MHQQEEKGSQKQLLELEGHDSSGDWLFTPRWTEVPLHTEDRILGAQSHLQGEQPNGEKPGRDDCNGTKEDLHVWPGHLPP